MSAVTQILVVLRNADPTALTALSSLQRYLGFGEQLIDVRRGVLWELAGPAGADPASLLEALRRSGELWNPNKETARVRRPGGPESELELPGSPAEGWESFLAWDPERDLDRTPRALRPARASGWRLKRGILWSTRWRSGDPEERLSLASSAVVCSGPRKGLLVHPHLEDHRRIVPGAPVPWLPEPAGDGGR